jgi:hypothetical protein
MAGNYFSAPIHRWELFWQVQHNRLQNILHLEKHKDGAVSDSGKQWCQFEKKLILYDFQKLNTPLAISFNGSYVFPFQSKYEKNSFKTRNKKIGPIPREIRAENENKPVTAKFLMACSS